MRIAAIYDVHANLAALDAVLHDVSRLDVDLIVVGGDVIPGPQPRESLDRLRMVAVPIRFVRGNGEREVLALRAGKDVSVPNSFLESMHWVGNQLTSEQVALIETWPATISVASPSLGCLLFCHATPQSDSAIFTAQTPTARLVREFHGLDAAIVVCGHTHMQFDRRIGDVRVINAGSVGMPFQSAGAYWLLLDTTAELRCTRYDVEAAARQIEATDYPLANDFAEQYVRTTPDHQMMMGAFEKASLRDLPE